MATIGETIIDEMIVRKIKEELLGNIICCQPDF
jgi:hypothetical protein